jgi:hypothetical protein
MLLGVGLVAISIQLAHHYVHQDETPTTVPVKTIHIDEYGIEHGQPGHDHGLMMQMNH